MLGQRGGDLVLGGLDGDHGASGDRVLHEAAPGSDQGHRGGPHAADSQAGQKAQFWEIVIGCVVYLITGIVLWIGADTFGRWTVAASYVLHDISALIMLGGIFIHIYLSTIGEPGTFQSMTRGAVSHAWAWTFHPAWYKEVTGRDPKQAYEEARNRMRSGK